MSSLNQFEHVDPGFLAAFRVAVGREPINLDPACDHAPVICTWKSQQDDRCKIQPLADAWREADHTYTQQDDPLVLALANAGCDAYRARMVISQEGYGMTPASSESLIGAYRRLGHSIRHPVPVGVQVCHQCRPGTTTFALQGSLYVGSCHFVPVSIGSYIDVVEEGKVLCIGAGGELRWCGNAEFMAVSHVWEHGWQGDSEKGLCSRTLDLLLFVASLFGLEWVWIDIAMVSQEPISRSLAINSMNFVYASSKATVVFDRLLVSMDRGSDRERVMAIFLADWMTRVWTMQEALLSQDLVFLFGDCHLRGSELQSSMIHDPPQPDLHWQQWRAIRSLCIILEGYVTPMLDRICTLSKERLTTKKEDMARAIFPLFGLKWPGRATTLEEGQAKILQHLGNRAARLAPRHGPIMPQPWSWAPLVVAGTSGALLPQGTERPLYPDGLRGQWAAWRVREVLGKVHHGRESYNDQLAGLTGTCYDTVKLHVEGTSLKFLGQVFSRPENTWPWTGQELFLVWANNAGTPRTRELDYYELVVKDARPHHSGTVLYHRVGSAAGTLENGSGGEGLDVGDFFLDGYMN
ncbi:hypothetical protein MHUMG1_10604 [Metarhizium humberi]|uniref:Heterokaryon incompatibility domain-containing protein n=1 Tax=Metarhizium humberi TaxID=2596975 RepID=A0A9P8S306_9HYPO|nr:hypothetical protein MHUMG1_10604 [Metarhizium humberi]